MAGYYSKKQDFEKGSNTILSNNASTAAIALWHIDQVESTVSREGLSHLYRTVGDAYFGRHMPESDLIRAESRARSMLDSLRQVHQWVMENIDGKLVAGMDEVMNKLDKINEGTYTYRSSHLTRTMQQPYPVSSGGMASNYGSMGMGTGVQTVTLPYTMTDLLGAKIATQGCRTKPKEVALEGAWKVGEVATTGTAGGIPTSASAKGELVGGSVKMYSKGTWGAGKIDSTGLNQSKKEIGVGAGIEVEGHLAQGSAKGQLGILSAEVKGDVGKVSAKGEIGLSLYKEGKFSPSFDVKGKAKAVAATGEVKLQAGDDKYNVYAEAQGELLKAEAEAGIGFGAINDTGTEGSKGTQYGVQAKAGAEAYLAEGEISGGFTLFGIKFSGSIGGKVGGAGATAEAKVTTGAAEGKLGLGFLLGAEVSFGIDWSGFKLF